MLHVDEPGQPVRSLRCGPKRPPDRMVAQAVARIRSAGSSARIASPAGSRTRGGSGSSSHGWTVRTAGSPARFSRSIASKDPARRAHPQAPAPAHRHHLPEPIGDERRHFDYRPGRGVSAHEDSADSATRPDDPQRRHAGVDREPFFDEDVERPQRPVVDRPLRRAEQRHAPRRRRRQARRRWRGDRARNALGAEVVDALVRDSRAIRSRGRRRGPLRPAADAARPPSRRRRTSRGRPARSSRSSSDARRRLDARRQRDPSCSSASAPPTPQT